MAQSLDVRASPYFSGTSKFAKNGILMVWRYNALVHVQVENNAITEAGTRRSRDIGSLCLEEWDEQQ